MFICNNHLFSTMGDAVAYANDLYMATGIFAGIVST